MLNLFWEYEKEFKTFRNDQRRGNPLNSASSYLNNSDIIMKIFLFSFFFWHLTHSRGFRRHHNFSTLFSISIFLRSCTPILSRSSPTMSSFLYLNRSRDLIPVGYQFKTSLYMIIISCHVPKPKNPLFVYETFCLAFYFPQLLKFKCKNIWHLTLWFLFVIIN